MAAESSKVATATQVLLEESKLQPHTPTRVLSEELRVAAESSKVTTPTKVSLKESKVPPHTPQRVLSEELRVATKKDGGRPN